MINLARGIFLFPSFVALVWVSGEQITRDHLIQASQPAIISSALAVCSLSLQIRGYQISPISATVPFMSFQSVFAMFVSWIAMNEIPSQIGVIGVTIVTLGAFWLNSLASDSRNAPSRLESASDDAKSRDEKLSEGPRFTTLPWWLGKAQVERGTLYILGTAFMFSFQSALDKAGSLRTGTFVYGAVYSGFLVYFNFAALIVVEKGNLLKPNAVIPSHTSGDHSTERTWQQLAIVLRNHFVSTDWMMIWVNTMLWFVSYSTFLLAMEVTLVAYCVAIKRAGCLVTVIIGWLLFHERGFWRKLPAIVLMVFGVMVIVASRDLDDLSVAGLSPIALVAESTGRLADQFTSMGSGR